jgi:hypothetical protein
MTIVHRDQTLTAGSAENGFPENTPQWECFRLKPSLEVVDVRMIVTTTTACQSAMTDTASWQVAAHQTRFGSDPAVFHSCFSLLLLLYKTGRKNSDQQDGSIKIHIYVHHRKQLRSFAVFWAFLSQYHRLMALLLPQSSAALQSRVSFSPSPCSQQQAHLD